MGKTVPVAQLEERWASDPEVGGSSPPGDKIFYVFSNMKKYTFVDYLVQKEKAQKKFFKNYLNYAKKIKKNAQEK